VESWGVRLQPRTVGPRIQASAFLDHHYFYVFAFFLRAILGAPARQTIGCSFSLYRDEQSWEQKEAESNKIMRAIHESQQNTVEPEQANNRGLFAIRRNWNGQDASGLERETPS
jgi:hypothetical protein